MLCKLLNDIYYYDIHEILDTNECIYSNMFCSNIIELINSIDRIETINNDDIHTIVYLRNNEIIFESDFKVYKSKYLFFNPNCLIKLFSKFDINKINNNTYEYLDKILQDYPEYTGRYFGTSIYNRIDRISKYINK